MSEPDWSEDKAQEYNRKWWDKDAVRITEANAALAALLREAIEYGSDDASSIWSHRMSDARAEARLQTLSEVRRVVEKTKDDLAEHGNADRFCDLILERLEKL